MYTLLAIDAVIRIVLALAFLFMFVPAMTRLMPARASRLERFFWSFGAGITIITLAGQLLTLANLFSLLTLLLLAGTIILMGRARAARQSPIALVRRSSELAFLALLNVFERRINVMRRIRRRYRRSMAGLRERLQPRATKIELGAWLLLTAVAAGFRLYRPFTTANLGYPDTYGHMYLMKLIEQGRQVDPDWGPYPVGLHFLLVTIQHLTNVDPILLMNFFGAVVGVIITIGVAHAARSLSGSLAAGLISGFLFATLVGGPSQYFIGGGAFLQSDTRDAALRGWFWYGELAPRAAFDLTFWTFQRQTSTLSQELAIALLFPAAIFLLQFLRYGFRWHLLGFAGCTSAVAAVHSGVVLPLLLMCAVMLVIAVANGGLLRGQIRRVLVTLVLAVVIGSMWMLAFVKYPPGPASRTGQPNMVWSTAIKYFPLLGSLSGKVRGEAVEEPARVAVQPTAFFAMCALVAVALIVAAFRDRENRLNLLWIALVFLLFLGGHFASTAGLPQLVSVTRNAQWLLMSMTVLLAVAAVEAGRLLRARSVRFAVAAILLLLWGTRVPLLSEPIIHDRLVDSFGYGGASLAVLEISRSLEPFQWTVVSYGQEFPLVLGGGYYVPAVDFLEQYDPAADVTPIPTPQIFIIVEKKAHPFQISTWARRFSRSDIERRLQTWVHVYQSTHRNVRVFLEDEDVRVYQIERTDDEMERLMRRRSENG